MATKGKFLVGAIDFGTTYSGWAYSFLHDYNSDPTKAIVRHWYSGTDTLATEKTPTCALIAPDGKTLEGFGYEAENKYQKLVENGTHRQHYFFKRFKMALDKLTIKRDLLIKDEMGKSLSAMTVVSLSIGYLADNMIKFGSDTISGDLSTADVDWVLTVPAIWSDAAKQFMREAAEQAGLQKDKLTIALEPEAASIFVRHLPVSKKGCVEISTMEAGTQYVVLDAGGGTIDITVHEIYPGGGLGEVHAASGGGWGGVLVDKAFQDLITDLVGPEIYEEFVKTETEDWIYLWRTFESKKKTILPENDDTINIRFPASLPSLYLEKTKHELHKNIKSSKYAKEIQLRRDKMFISSRIMKGLFYYSVQTTVAHLKAVLHESESHKIKAILMVGGFSESRVLQEAIKKEFSHLHVIIPPAPSSIVLRGSVIFGHDPLSIKQRILKKTYGSLEAPFFDAKKHPEDKKKNRYFEGKTCHVVEMFWIKATQGEAVVVGQTLSEEAHRPIFPSQDAGLLKFYASDVKEPVYIDDSCTPIGEMDIDLSGLPDDEKDVMVSLNFGDTEIKATARIKKTGKASNVKLNFLG